METKDRRKLGKKSRAAGKRFEIKVREDLEKKGWIVFRNSNDATPQVKKKSKDGSSEEMLVPFVFKQAKSKWNPFTKMPMTMQSGFPDFVCIRQLEYKDIAIITKLNQWDVQFVECKLGKYLDKIEKEKVQWIKDNLKIPVIVASKGLKRGEINYEKI